MIRKDDITAESVRQILDYEPDTGLFRWRVKRGNVLPGYVAGHMSFYGYTVIKIAKRAYFAHRLAWLCTHGEWPIIEIDHVNGTRSDNRICNLRLATRSQNGANSQLSKRNSTGLKGVKYDPRAKKKKWTARIVVNRREIYLGSFIDAESAHRAYCAAAETNFGNFAKFG